MTFRILPPLPFRSLTALFMLTTLLITTSRLVGAQSTSFLPEPMHGVTIDAIDHLDQVIKSLSSLSRTPTVRIVFDEWVPASVYQKAVARISDIAYIMGELLDSSAFNQYSVRQYERRVQEYLDAFGDRVDLWEIGNEINGEWLGRNRSVLAKMTTAYEIVKRRGFKVALTLYYNEGCFERRRNEMFRWAEKNIPLSMKQGLDYVLVSYYEDDCEGLQPDWQSVFEHLGDMFPNSKIGIGECGTADPDRKEEYIKRYYNMYIDHPRYVGGYFWWYFKQDMVPMSKPLWHILNDSFQGP